VWGLASSTFGAIDTSTKRPVVHSCLKSRYEWVRVWDRDCFSEKVLLTEEFDPGSD
jgi:hypothetical protein